MRPPRNPRKLMTSPELVSVVHWRLGFSHESAILVDLTHGSLYLRLRRRLR
jgi:hypothetical protein